MITRKAAIGFLLLAAIVFLTAYYTSPAPTLPAAQGTGTIEPQTLFPGAGHPPVVKYQAPLLSFKEPWQGALAATIVMELFALICYLALKRLEPVINRAAEKAMRNLREQNERRAREESEEEQAG